MTSAPNEMSRNSHDVPSFDGAAIERAINTLGGVCGVRVVVDQAEIKEVHVLASLRRAPKKIIRDIESMLLVQYGYRIDYRRISLAQVADAAPPVAERIALDSVEQVRTPQGFLVVVVLADGQRAYRGTQPVDDNAALAAGKATITALNDVLAPAAPLALRGMECTAIGGRQVMLAYVLGNNGEHLLGTAFVQSSVPAAAARAVLGATNRHLAEWLHENTTTVLARTIGA